MCKHSQISKSTSMQKFLPFSVKLSCTLFFIVMIFTGCLKDKLTKTYTILTPVYKDKSEVLANIKSNAPQPLKATGKIYLYGKYIFLNEVNKGVHIIDNSHAAMPVKVGFIDIPGNIDIAVKGNTLYADLYTDLLAIDITNPLQAKLSKLVSKVFPERAYGNGFMNDSSKIIIDWIKKDTTVDVVPETGGWRGCPNCLMMADAAMGSTKAGTFVPGVGGSMARFAIVNDYLYAVNLHSLQVLNVGNTSDPQKISTSGVGWNIETIYPFKNKLFIGSSNGMFIYDISTPHTPVRQGQFMHARACDPVVADDNYAYVTLRAGTFCEGTNNQLDVINVQNVMQPALLKTYPMTNPHGLSKDGNLLFICDGKDGLKIYDAAQPGNIKLLKQIKGIETYEAIAWNKKLLIVATNGLYQYDYSDINNIKLLSTITLNR